MKGNHSTPDSVIHPEGFGRSPDSPNSKSGILKICLFAVFLLGTSLSSFSQEKTEEANGEKPADKKEEKAGSKSLEERKQTLFLRSSEAYLKRGGHQEYLQSTAERLKKALDLDEPRSLRVDKLVERTFQEMIKLGVPAIAEQFAKYSKSYQEGRLATESGALRIVSVSSMPDLPDPLETKIWKDGLSKILKPDEAKAWKHNLKLRREDERTEDIARLKEIIEFREERDHRFLKSWVDQRVARIVADLSLTKEEEKEIRETGKTFLKESMDSIATTSIEEIGKASHLERKRILKMAPSRSPTHIRPEDQSQKEWDLALADHLDPDEIKRLKDYKEKRRERNIEAVSLVAYHSLDRYLHFALEQEAQVLPILRTRVRDRIQQYTRPHHPPLGMSLLVSDLRRDEVQEKLKAVLTPAQQEAFSLFLESFGYFSTTLNFAEWRKEHDTDNIPKSFATERFVGIYMKERLDWERQRRMIPLLSQISEIDREIGLTEPEKQSLQIAAKGAVTREIEPLNERLPASARSQIERSLKGGKDEQRLQIHMNLQTNHITAAETDIWKNMIESILDPEEETRFREMEGRRMESEIAAYVEMALSDIDAILYISEEQSKELRPLFEKGFEEYLPYLKRSQIYSRNWFEFFSGGMIVSFNTVPEKKRNSIFTSEQKEIWKTKYQSRVKSSWDQALRLREAEEKEKKKQE